MPLKRPRLAFVPFLPVHFLASRFTRQGAPKETTAGRELSGVRRLRPAPGNGEVAASSVTGPEVRVWDMHAAERRE